MDKPPIRAMKDTAPKAPDPHWALMTFLIRAYEFWNHPFYRGEFVGPDEVLLDSLAFRLRPLMLTEGDDGSIWATLDRFEQRGGDSSLVRDLRGQTLRWYDLTAAELGIERPNVSSLNVMVQRQVDALPRYALWDFVNGLGIHTDHRRVIRGVMARWSGSTTVEFREYWQRVILALIHAARPLVIAVHNAVLDLVSTNGQDAGT